MGQAGCWVPFARSAEIGGKAWISNVKSVPLQCVSLCSSGAKFHPHISGGTRHRLLYRGHRERSVPFPAGFLDDPNVKASVCSEPGVSQLRVPRRLLRFLFQELLRGVRYLPQCLALSWCVHIGKYSNKPVGHRTVPQELCGPMPQEPMRLLDNSMDEPASQPPHFKGDLLRPEQLKSLAWMLAREGHEKELLPFIVEWRGFETNWEYSVNHWLLELRAFASYSVRGGILADDIGYGKTATTIALIDTTLKVPTPKVPKSTRSEHEGLQPAAGTLVLVPSNLVFQWASEISKFVSVDVDSQACPVKVFVITDETSSKDLTSRKFYKMDVIICPYSHLFDTSFEVIRRFFWRRLVLDEFHEVAGFARWQQTSLQHLQAHYRWGLTGTPPLNDVASVIFMSSLFHVDLPGFLAGNPNAWNSDLFMWRTAQSFLDHFARCNTAVLPHIGLVEHLVVVRQTPEERALYLLEEVGHLDEALNMAQKLCVMREEAQLELLMRRLERLLKLCAHFDISESNAASAKDECARIGYARRQSLNAAREDLLRCWRAVALFQQWPGFYEPTTPEPAARDENAMQAKRDCADLQRIACNAVEELLQTISEKSTFAQRELVGGELRASLKGTLAKWCEDIAHGLVDHLVQAKPCDINSLSQGSPLAQFYARTMKKNKSAVRLELDGRLEKRLSELRDATAGDLLLRRLLSAVRQGDDEARGCSICLETSLPVNSLAITPCAHIFCYSCLKLLADNDQLHFCSFCRQPLAMANIRRLAEEVVEDAQPDVDNLDENDEKFSRYGTKVAAIAKKVRELRAADATTKVILFVQFDDLKSKVACALTSMDVPNLELKGSTLERAAILRDWQDNVTSDKFVLILSLAESASGASLTAAGHVVFLHPMLAATQARAVLQERQAIGRARRFGQRRHEVHVWRFVTAETIEQTITQTHRQELWEHEHSLSSRDPTGSAVLQ